MMHSPAFVLKNLFIDVQNSGMFADSKTFADAIPKSHPEFILNRYNVEKKTTDFDLERFVHQNFHFFKYSEPELKQRDITEHIEHLWDVLTRPADTPQFP